MQFKTVTAAMALLVSFAAAVPKEVTVEDTVGLTDGEFSELYCCGLGRRGEHNTRCCKRDVELLTREVESELYCCGLGKRGELNTRCC